MHKLVAQRPSGSRMPALYAIPVPACLGCGLRLQARWTFEGVMMFAILIGALFAYYYLYEIAGFSGLLAALGAVIAFFAAVYLFSLAQDRFPMALDVDTGKTQTEWTFRDRDLANEVARLNHVALTDAAAKPRKAAAARSAH